LSAEERREGEREVAYSLSSGVHRGERKETIAAVPIPKKEKGERSPAPSAGRNVEEGKIRK